MNTFEKAVTLVLRREGGYVNHPSDPGGATNFGISQRWVNSMGFALDIKDISRDQAVEYYFDYFWEPYGLDELESEILAIKFFDAIVNLGPSQATKCLQRSLRATGKNYVNDDGGLGPITKRAIKESTIDYLLIAFRSEIACHYRRLVDMHPNNKAFIKGWLRRAYDEID
ncbi:MAG: glycoside hydrolase family 108 protein [Candidatus Hodarchaeales archaeon]|jgi:lysozyme family protein